MKNQRGYILVIIILVALIGLVLVYLLPKFGIKNTTAVLTQPVWKNYKGSNSYSNLSFDYSEKYPVYTEAFSAFSETGGQGIALTKFDIDNFDYAQSNLSKSEMQKYYNDLKKGNVVGKSPLSPWSLDSSNQIKKLKSGKFFRISTTFSAYEVCDFKFHTTIEIPQDNSLIEVTIYGDTDKIRNSMMNSDLLTLWEGCDKKSFASGGMKKFWNQLVAGQATTEAKDWYDTATRVIDTINF